MLEKRKIIITDLRNNKKHIAIIKLCRGIHFKKRLGYYILTDYDMFCGQECMPLQKEGFRYSWVLAEEENKEFKKIKLETMYHFSADDWHYALPHDWTINKKGEEFLNIRFDDKIKIKKFKRIEL